MRAGKRIFGVVTGAAMFGALCVGTPVATVAADASPGAAVNFTFQPGQAAIVAHYTVSPAGRGEGNAVGRGTERTITRSPKGDQSRNSKVASGGVNSDNSVADTARSDNTGTPSASASFIGQQGSATTCSYFGPGCNPPDMALGASPQFVVQGVNTQWEVLDTSGRVQAGFPVSAQNFFGVPNVTNANGTSCDTAHQSQPFLSDPRALYDAVDGRFWAAMLQLEGAGGIAMDCPFKTVYYVSVSQTSNPNGKWNVYEFDMSMGRPFNADYTQLGINGQAVYFSSNMFANNGNGFYAELFEANKAKMEKGQGGFTADGFFNLQGTGPGTSAATGPFLADTVQPTVNLDASAGAAEVFVDTVDGPDLLNGHFCGFTGGGLADACSGLVVWKMTNPTAHDHGGPAPTLTATYEPTKPFAVSPAADQPSCNQCIDALDLRITGTPVIRNGVIYGTWDTAVNNRTQVVPGIEWAQISLAGLGSQDSSTTGYYNYSGDAAATFGTVMPDAQGNVTMVFDHMSQTVFPEIRYIQKSADGNFHGAGVLLKAGESSYRPELCGTAGLPVCRWGDYEAASFDGAGHIWMASQYANHYNGLTTPPAFGRNWGTWIGAINIGDSNHQ
ncbi:MAG TPA: hypothetical protein VGG90_01240 [Candidatus Dormibacteraeota bacterium]